MTVAEQILLARQDAFFRPVMVKALTNACKLLLTAYQVTVTKKMHVKDYDFALQFLKTCTVSDAVFSSCISNLLDTATYIDPQDDPDEAADALFIVIRDDYQASFIQGGASVYPSWIEMEAGYVKGDEDTI